MTIETTAIKSVAVGNGATTVWSFTFLIPALEDLKLSIVNITSGDTTVISPVNFSVSGLGSPIGGSVTYPLVGAPVSAAYYVVVERALPLKQETDLQNQGAAYPESIEAALDYLTMVTQQLQDQINRSIVFGVADLVETPLPSALARANMFLGFDVNGAPVALAGLTPGTTVSPAMIPVVTAPTTAAALTALGLPGNLLDLLIPSGTEWAYHAAGIAPTGFVYPSGQPCTALYPDYRAKLIAAGSPYGNNGTDPLMPDRRSTVIAGNSIMGGVNNGLLTGGGVLGAVLGGQSKTLLNANLPPYTPSGTNATIAVDSNVSDVLRATAHDNFTSVAGDNGPMHTITGNTIHSTGPAPAFTGNAQGGTSTPFSIVQPTFIANVILKVH